MNISILNPKKHYFHLRTNNLSLTYGTTYSIISDRRWLSYSNTIVFLQIITHTHTNNYNSYPIQINRSFPIVVWAMALDTPYVVWTKMLQHYYLNMVIATSKVDLIRWNFEEKLSRIKRKE